MERDYAALAFTDSRRRRFSTQPSTQNRYSGGASMLYLLVNATN